MRKTISNAMFKFTYKLTPLSQHFVCMTFVFIARYHRSLWGGKIGFCLFVVYHWFWFDKKNWKFIAKYIQTFVWGPINHNEETLKKLNR